MAVRSLAQVAPMTSARWRGECAIVRGSQTHIASLLTFAGRASMRGLTDRCRVLSLLLLLLLSRAPDAFHFHCITRWLRTRPSCPLDNQESARTGTDASAWMRICAPACASAAEGHAAHGAVHSHLLAHHCFALPVGSTALHRVFSWEFQKYGNSSTVGQTQ